MSLFQTSVVKKYLNDLSPELIDKKYKAFQDYFGNPERQENIRNSKEEEYQSGFVSALFVNILEYTLNPEPNFNFVLEKKNVDDSKKADGAILKDENVVAVIELKSTKTTDLDTVETQAFGYKVHNPKCQYVITSNFEKIRFYIQNTTEHLEYDLFNLSKEDFAMLWLCLSKDNILSDIPLKIKEASVLQEENVTKKLYKDYSKFREEIFANIIKNNPEFDKLVLFKKTQKLLDRFLFIFFAEDRLLVPPNSINQIIDKWKDDVDFGDDKPLYSIFKQYFHVLNVGRPKSGKRQEIFAYNGGLFLPDEILDNIKIDDEVLHKHTMQLSTYDFETEVDVNILGHIFEHSLSEIENVQAEIAGEVIDKQKTKRKKDGIFYTPKYITKYIVENTVGKLCEEKRNELGIIDEEYAKGRRNRKKEIVKDLDNKLTAYREWLLEITILDPACGSGAFLNQALEFLINEHKKIDELKAQLLGGSIVFPDIEAKILEKNIYGVDLNEESVEIAKLSLWLRTAQKGRKLTTLSNHVKCGNSLIDDPEIAGEKAFNWRNEFPEIFKQKEKKAFHVVFAINNSRYVHITDGLTRRFEPGFIARTFPKLEPDEEEILADCLNEVVKEKQLNILACNISGDHVHAIIVCDPEEITDIMRQWKGRSAYLYNRRLNPSVDNQKPEYSDGTKQKLWAKSFNKTEIADSKQLENTIKYIRNNREKHELPPTTDGLTRLLSEMTCTTEHAFRTEYKGGFDIVIGNPPWGAKLDFLSAKYLVDKYPIVPSKIKDTYLYFSLLSLSIIKSSAYLGLIIPNTWLLINNASEFRKYILNYKIDVIIDHGDDVFQDAIVESTTLILQNIQLLNSKCLTIREKFGRQLSHNIIDKSVWISDDLNRIVIDIDISAHKLLKRIEQISERFEDSCEIIFGIKPYQVGHGIPTQTQEDVNNRIYHSVKNEDDGWFPLVTGTDVNRYSLVFNNNAFIKYGKWLMYSSNHEKINNPKLLLRRTSSDLRVAYDVDCFYPQNSLFIITSSKYELPLLMAFLNSKLFAYLYKNKCPQVGKVFAEVKPSIIKSLPIIKNDNLNMFSRISEKVELMNSYSRNSNKELYLFTKTLIEETEIEKITKKLSGFYLLSFEIFKKELKKQKIEFSFGEENNKWRNYFNSTVEKINQFQSEITKTDKEIDQMVYELYGLTEEEIKIVEETN